MTRDEFEYLLTVYEKDIYSICTRLTGSKEEADELFQDTWLSVMEEIENIDLKRNPKSYIIGKALLIWKGKRRKYARRSRIAPLRDVIDDMDNVVIADENNSPEQIMEKQELRHTIKTEVALLKEKYRVVIELYYALDLSAAEISSILKIPQGTVESRLYKARKLLKIRMEDQGYEIE